MSNQGLWTAYNRRRQKDSNERYILHNGYFDFFEINRIITLTKGVPSPMIIVPLFLS